MPLNPTTARQRLNEFEFKLLFIEELGWSKPRARQREEFECLGSTFARRPIAELGGVVVFEVESPSGTVPDSDAIKAIHKHISSLFHENLLIFIDEDRSQSLWYWVKREGTKLTPRRHSYFKGQPGDLFLSKITAMFVDISELDSDGNIGVAEAAKRLQLALDVQTTTTKFFREFQNVHTKFLTLIQGIDDDRDRRWYASVLLNRLMFIYFLQRKGFLDVTENRPGGDLNYLQAHLASYNDGDEGSYYSIFLKALFFQGFAIPSKRRSAETNRLLGRIIYLNGGLFLEHQIEERWPNISIPNVAFKNLFDLFGDYSWNLNDTPRGDDNEINPDVLGYIFEKYINQKAFGAYYTRTEITEYLCEQTIHRLILDKVNVPAITGISRGRHFDTVPDMLLRLDTPICKLLLADILPGLSLLDPACGSGAFLVAAMKTLINVYSAVVGKVKFLNDSYLKNWVKDAESGGRSLSYEIKKRIITDNLYGVDIMEESTEIAKLRLFLALVSSAQTVEQLEPLPNIDFNILAGNSLVGLLRVTDEEFKRHEKEASLFQKPYSEVLAEKNRLIDSYRNTAVYMEDLRAQRDHIDQLKQEAQPVLNDILLDEFKGIKYEQATWDTVKNTEGRPKKRAVVESDLVDLKPLHWGYEFDEILNKRGGFDAIITNPPWEIFKPQAKEFFTEHSELITKNKMTIEQFEVEKAGLLGDTDVRDTWLAYQSRFPHVSGYYRTAGQYKNQISVVNGKKAGTDINLYKLFTEQCFNLLRKGGQCGTVIPSGIYTDLGTKQLREMLFEQSKITGLFCFENRKTIFENVDSRFKFVVLTFEKGGNTLTFPTAFMRHDVAELERFPRDGALQISVALIKRLSPDSASIMEFKSDIDIRIAEKMIAFPLLGEKIEGKWNLSLTSEFHMTNDAKLFHASPGKGRLPLYEGKMIHQYNASFSEPRYWVDEAEGRKALLKRDVEDEGQKLDYQGYRLGFRDIARNTDQRTMISTIVPPGRFAGNTLVTSHLPSIEPHILVILALLNSFAVDFVIRQKVTSHCNMFAVYQLPVPRLTHDDPQYQPILIRAASLICTTVEFAGFWNELDKEIGLDRNRPYKKGGLAWQPGVGATSASERAKLRAELDGLIAHLYGLSEAEFNHILSTFPLVPEPTIIAARNAYRDVATGVVV